MPTNEIFFDGYGTNMAHYRTRTMGAIYAQPHDDRPEAEGKVGPEYFAYHFTNSGLSNRLLDDDNYGLETIYALLMARHANDHIVSSDEERFKLLVDTIVWQYAPTWQRWMELEDERLGLELDDIQQGATAIRNHAEHPDTAPDLLHDEILDYIDDQNSTIYRKAPLDAIENFYSIERENRTEWFLAKFDNLFAKFAYPAETLDYVSED